MRVFIPRPGEPIAEVKTKDVRHLPPVGPEWYRWFQLLWSSLGWNPATPINTDIGPTHTGATGSNAAIVGGLYAQTWSASADEQFFGGFVLPNHYSEGTAVTPYLVIAGTSSGTGTVVMNFTAGPSLNEGNISVSVFEQKEVTLSNSLVPTRMEFTEIAGTSLRRGTYIPFTFEREGTAAEDTYPNTTAVIAVGLKIQVQGSGQEARFP